MKKFTQTGLWTMLGNPKSANNGFDADAVLNEFVEELQCYCREEKNIAERTRSLWLARNELGSHTECLRNGSKKKVPLRDALNGAIGYIDCKLTLVEMNLEYPKRFLGDGLWEALVSSWLEYKRSRNESYKSDMSVKKFHTMLRNLSRGDPPAARRIIDKSIANNWAGIFELTENDSRPRGQPNQPATGQRIGQIKQPEDEERRRKLLEKFGGSGNDGKNKT